MGMDKVFALLLLAFCAVAASGADYAQAGALAKNGDWEISITYDNTVNRSSALADANYLLPANAQITDLREQPLDNGVVLTVSGLATNAAYTLTVTNVQTVSGTVLPPLPLSFTAKSLTWTAIGAQEFGFAPDVVANGDGGFDLVSGGSQMSGFYDESTFVYESITGDFDKRVRVASQEDSSQEARAGLMVRETLDDGKVRPVDPSNPDEAFSRYLQVQVAPVGTDYTDFDGSAVPGLNQYQVNVRFLTGGSTDQPSIATNTPAYPNAWLRLKRVGQTFHVFSGTDGTNWTRLGTYTFPTTDSDGNPVPTFSKAAFVGPNYSPEVANIPDSTGVRRAFLARFRDYSNASGAVQLDPPQLTISPNGSQLSVAWTGGTLQGSTNLANNVWTDLGTSSPLLLTPDKRYQFFRARNP